MNDSGYDPCSQKDGGTNSSMEKGALCLSECFGISLSFNHKEACIHDIEHGKHGTEWQHDVFCQSIDEFPNSASALDRIRNSYIDARRSIGISITGPGICAISITSLGKNNHWQHKKDNAEREDLLCK